MKFNGVEITPATIQRTREHFAEISQACIDDAKTGRQRVNDLASYVAFHEKAIRVMLDANITQYSVTFMQRAHWLQTGESVALLP